MSTTKVKKIEKTFDSKYTKPHMMEMLEEQGWVYEGMKNNKPVFSYFL